jgi:hypothetical protein
VRLDVVLGKGSRRDTRQRIHNGFAELQTRVLPRKFMHHPQLGPCASMPSLARAPGETPSKESTAHLRDGTLDLNFCKRFDGAHVKTHSGTIPYRIAQRDLKDSD